MCYHGNLSHLTHLSHPTDNLSVSQVSVCAGGRGTHEVCFSVAGWIFSFVSSYFLHWWAAFRGGVSSANQITGSVQVVQRLHPTPGCGRSVSPALIDAQTPTHTLFCQI